MANLIFKITNILYICKKKINMKKIVFAFIFGLLAVQNGYSQIKSDDILGEWLSEEKDGKVMIYKQGNKYYGKLSWLLRSQKKDEFNPDPKLRDQLLMGKVILKEFNFEDGEWENGTIYDPKSGKTYSCVMKLTNNKQQLDIRGYIGMPMFGRTSIWTRPK